MITMHDVTIVIKSLAILCIAWFTELAIGLTISLAIVPQDVREFFAETKEIINWIVSASVLILTIIKIRNERKNKSKQ